jgi:hypothetical protein
MIAKPINATLPATGTGAAAITLAATQDCSDWRIQARTAVDMKISDVEALTTYYTVKSGTSITASQFLPAGAVIFWAESGAGASVVEVLPVVRR